MTDDPAPAIDAVGDDARTVAVVNLLDVATQLRGHYEEESATSKIPELKALAALRGVDFKHTVAVSYTPSMSAVILAVRSRWFLDRSIGEPVLEESGVKVHAITDVTYFVDDGRRVWMVDSRTGPAGAAAKRAELAAKADRPLAEWKRALLAIERTDTAIQEDVTYTACAITRWDDRYVAADLKFADSSLTFHAECVDSAGKRSPWFAGGEWGTLGRADRIDPRDEFALAIGGFHGAAPTFVSLPSLGSVKALTLYRDFKAFEAAGGLRTLDFAGLSADSAATVGTPYTGCNLVASVNLPKDAVVQGMPAVSALALARGATFDARIDMMGTDGTFLSEILRIIKR